MNSSPRKSLTLETINTMDNIREQLKCISDAIYDRLNISPQYDDGLDIVFGYVRNIRNYYGISPREKLIKEAPAAVLDTYTSEMVPAYAAITALFQETWDDMRAALDKGATTDDLTVTFLQQVHPHIVALGQGKLRLADAVIDELPSLSMMSDAEMKLLSEVFRIRQI